MNRDLDTDQAQDYFFSLFFNETVLFLSNYRRDFYLESKRSGVKICVNSQCSDLLKFMSLNIDF